MMAILGVFGRMVFDPDDWSWCQRATAWCLYPMLDLWLRGPAWRPSLRGAVTELTGWPGEGLRSLRARQAQARGSIRRGWP